MNGIFTTSGIFRVCVVPILCCLCLAIPKEARAATEFPPIQAAGVTFGGGAFADSSFEDVPYVSAEFLGDLFASALRWEPAAQQLRVRDPRGREWSFTLDNPFMAVAGEVYNLTYPVRRGPERVYIPLHPLLRLLRTRFGIDLDLASGTATAVPIPAPSPPAPEPALPAPDTEATPQTAPGRIAGLSVEETPEGAVLHIQAGAGIQWQGMTARPHYIVRAFGGKLDAPLRGRLEGAGPLLSAEARQQGNTAQFTLRLRDTRDSVELAPEEGGWRITVRAAAAMGSAGRGTVIVDAGHGGKDPGAIVKGVREADVNLAVAKLLRDELQARGYKVLLTRDTDEYKTLQERPKFASDNAGDLFVSLHCNSIAGTASRVAGVTGHVGYILREAESEEDKAIARRENMAIEEHGKTKKTEISPLDWILLEHQLNLYSKQSEALAESIVRNFAGFDIPKYTTGARQAGFFVLVGAYMPAVLFEMGFLTHERDRRTLSSREGQQEIARRLAVAVDGFQRARAKGSKEGDAAE
jgi:N-acetylmuramoyl-L-alanine amidase